MKPPQVWFAASGIVGAAAVVLLLAPQPSVWESWRPATCMPDRCFCEAIRPQLVRQPANAISGLAFAGVGLLVLLSISPTADRHAPVGRNAFEAQSSYSMLYAAASLLIGVGTTFYHASLTFWGQTVDVLGMYLIVTLLVLYNWSRLQRIPAAAVGIIYITGNAVLLTGLITVPAARRYAFAVLVILALGLELAARRKAQISADARLIGIAAGVFVAGFLAWIVDITKVACSPGSLLQGHALWHMAGAAALWLLFTYYRSAVPTVSD